LTRPYDEVLQDVRWGKVSLAGARGDYGVVLSGTPDDPVLDAPASDLLRGQLAAAVSADAPFFDRGPGYATLSGGSASADVDWL
jgi:N-methylhydantoinase B